MILGGRGGNLSVTCGTLPDSTTTQFVFTTTTSSTLEFKSAMESNQSKFFLMLHYFVRGTGTQRMKGSPLFASFF